MGFYRRAQREQSHTNDPIVSEFDRRKRRQRRPILVAYYALHSLGYLLFNILNPTGDRRQNSFLRFLCDLL